MVKYFRIDGKKRMYKILFFFVLLVNCLSCADIQYMVGGAHPRIPNGANILCTSSPIIDAQVYRSIITYNATERAREVERFAARVLTDGRYTPSRNGYKISEIPAKYEGDSGIDGLFVVKKDGKTFYLCVESKYSANGNFSFGHGIKISDNEMAGQMSTAWIKIIAHNLLSSADNSDDFREIFDRPGNVIRALAAGDREGNFQFRCLGGYYRSEFDINYLGEMFS